MEKNHPQPRQAEELLVEWLMLLQLPTHPRDLHGLMVEELILLGKGWLSPEQGHAERQQGGPSGSEAA